MKISYLSRAEKLVRTFTSFQAVMCYCMLGVIWVVTVLGQQDQIAVRQTQIDNAICYSRGQVVVSTDAGKRCAAPQSLGLVK